ncbi:MAG TPA: hypothetical protein VFJ29_06340, partial [Candidatus Kapabacteria bacterium]|nr:hypothetical protein [Candidatus Kapabacteria bacterium]
IVTVWISLIFFIAVCLHPGFQIFMVALGYMSIGVVHIVAARMSKAAEEPTSDAHAIAEKGYADGA